MKTTAAVLLVLALSVLSLFAKDGDDYPPAAILGIEAVTLTPGLEDVIGAPNRPGAYVVSPKGAGVEKPEHAGRNDALWPPIAAGDFVVAIDGKPVWTADDIPLWLDEKRPGQPVKVTIVRKGAEKIVEVRLKSGPPHIYLPSRTCAVPTGGNIAGQNIVPFLLFGIQVTALGGSELAGECPVKLEPCTKLELVKQSDSRTIVELNGSNFEIAGDWVRHTHIKAPTCKAEQKRIAEMTARRDEQQREQVEAALAAPSRN
jgi:hypothetical protein